MRPKGKRQKKPRVSRERGISEDKGSLYKQAKITIPVEANAIVISEGAFKSALEASKNFKYRRKSGIIILDDQSSSELTKEKKPSSIAARPIYAADEITQMKAVELAGIANSPNTLGIMADLMEKPDSVQQFTGSLFIVLHDSEIDRKNRRIESKRYDIVAVELSGTSPWLGTDARFAAGVGVPMLGGRCCGPSTLCVPLEPDDGGIDPRSLLKGRFWSSEIMGVTRSIPPDLKVRLDSGHDITRVSIFVDEATGVNGPGPSSSSWRSRIRDILKIGDVGFPLEPEIKPGDVGIGDTDMRPPRQLNFPCIRVVDPSCTKVKPICDPDDPGFIGDTEGGGAGSGGSGGDASSGSNPCGSSGSSDAVRPGRNVPRICEMITSWDHLPPECGGLCEHCGEPYYSAHKLDPSCQIKKTTGDSDDSCDISSEIREETKDIELQLRVGWTSGGGVKTRCEPAGEGGRKVCVHCDEDGECHETVEIPFIDPTIVQGSDQSSKENRDPSSDSESSRTHTFEPVYVTGTPQPPFRMEPIDIVVKVKTKEAAAPSEDPKGVERDGAGGVPPPEPGPEGTKSTSQTPDYEPHDFTINRSDATETGDPVRLGNGSLHMEQIDLSFDTPTGVFHFIRTYDSGSNYRSTMGSNWQHNWDVYLKPLDEETAPSWVNPYCMGTPNTRTSLLLHEGDGNVQLFFLDLQTYLFMPQAGSTDTIASTKDGGWALRSHDGNVRLFNSDGYLTNEQDRFGNGFKIEYELTPLYEMYKYYFFSERREQAEETKYSRRFKVLAYLNGELRAPEADDDCWKMSSYDPDADYPLPNDGSDLHNRLAYARDYFFHLLTLGPQVKSVYGFRKLRPIKVIDDLGRILEFKYYRAPVVNQAGNVTYDFNSLRETELLSEVKFKAPETGNVITTLQFKYDQPARYPSELNEMFLVTVDRIDGSVTGNVTRAPDRQIRFQYQWPLGPAGSYYYYSTLVFQKYLDYYSTFVGCWYKDRYVCEDSEKFGLYAKFAFGNPVALAQQEMLAYMSSVADNIIQVTNNGDVESETRYIIDPMSQIFDHVTSQRYGTPNPQTDQPAAISKVAALATIRPPLFAKNVSADENWQTSLPLIKLEYQDAGPTGDGDDDLTDSFLPEEIKNRYPLETPPLSYETVIERPAAAVEDSEIPVDDQSDNAADKKQAGSCDYDRMELLRRELPGFRNDVPYFDVIPTEAHPNLHSRLYRSRLSADQLALAQMSDPTHNDLLSTYEVTKLQTIQTIPTNIATRLDSQALALLQQRLDRRFVLKRILGRRKVISANVNRICSWVKLIDRDANIHYYGLNYRGQMLVDALKEQDSEHFVYTEKIYNADGLILQTRRPTLGNQLWTPNDGSTDYSYDEIDPDGNRGWNGWLPVFWSRRANLLLIMVHPRNLRLLDQDESTGQFTNTVGRFQRFTYEPLFNQVKSIETGSIELRPSPTGSLVLEHVDTVHSRIDYVFDYQELSEEEDDDRSSLDAILDDLRPWGFDWCVEPSTDTYDYVKILQWQLPLAFFGEDLNQDGSKGFRYGTRRADLAKGVPVLEIQSRPGSTNNTPKVIQYGWSPNGRPAFMRGPDGFFVGYESYSIKRSGSTVSYIRNAPPADTDVNMGFCGFLGRVWTLRFPDKYDKEYGPQEDPCPKLAGPYQWVLPSSSTSAEDDLAALGLPKEMVDAILDSTGRDKWLKTSFAYSEIGKLSWMWDETGAATQIVRDTDGREISIIDALGIRTTTSYTIHGLPKSIIKTDSSGKQLSETYREFDNEGRMVYECHALAKDGCLPLGSLSPLNGIVYRYEYSPDGLLQSTIDPEGLKTGYRYNERRLVVHQRSISVGDPQKIWRATSYEYDIDGNLVAIYHGDANGDRTGQLLTERFHYDGLGRIFSQTDIRGYEWQMAYSNRDLLMRFKRHDVPYGIVSGGSTSLPIWETVFTYDDFDLIRARYDNRIMTALYERTKAGAAYSSSSTGFGTAYMTYDLLGRPVWEKDAAGNQKIYTWRQTPHVSCVAYIRSNSKDRRRHNTTATITHLDASGQAIEEVQYAAGIEKHTRYTRDGLGFVVEELNPESALTIYERNWLGWPVRISQQRGLLPVSSGGIQFDVTNIEYNSRGQARRIIDPSNQATDFAYYPSGDLAWRRLPGQPVISSSFKYDILGRLVSKNIGGEEMVHRYDQRGDPVSESIVTMGIMQQPFIVRSFDELGRIQRAVNYNPALNWLPRSQRSVTLEIQYDPLGRLRAEHMRVGAGAIHEIYSNWSIVAGGFWQRDTSCYQNNMAYTEWKETYDHVSRLSQKAIRRTGTAVWLKTTFDWLGNIYLGRIQEQTGRQSPFRESREVDPFGLEEKIYYTAIDLNRNHKPINVSEGRDYCGGPWNVSQCGGALLEIDIIRDNMSRIVSQKSRFGYPRFRGSSLVTGRQHLSPWRGYSYTAQGFLHKTWEHPGINNEIIVSGLKSYSVTSDQIESLGSTAEELEYVREPSVGGTLRIVNHSTGKLRWSLPIARGIGHQIKSVDVDGDGIFHAIGYDLAGRIQNYGSAVYKYNPGGSGRIAAVEEGGNITEAYAYDPLGRLAALFDGKQPLQPVLSFLYDKAHMIAAFGLQNDLVWEAFWGPGIDKIIEWQDYSGGRGDNHIPLVDHRNSVVTTWDANSGRIAHIVDYSPEGRVAVRDALGSEVCKERRGTICKNSDDIPFGFVSAWRSTRTGLIYMRNRWYNTELGQFMSHDEVGYRDSYNLYAYGGFDPINKWDPFGSTSAGFGSNAETMIAPSPGTSVTGHRPPPGLHTPPVRTPPVRTPPVRTPPVRTPPVRTPPVHISPTRLLARFAFLWALLSPSTAHAPAPRRDLPGANDSESAPPLPESPPFVEAPPLPESPPFVEAPPLPESPPFVEAPQSQQPSPAEAPANQPTTTPLEVTWEEFIPRPGRPTGRDWATYLRLKYGKENVQWSSLAQLRNRWKIDKEKIISAWEQAHGSIWPTTKQGVHYIPHHEPPLSEGGTIWDITPMHPDIHKIIHGGGKTDKPDRPWERF